MSKTSVIVLGAGLQGICVAFALANRGYAVRVIDQAEDSLLRASLRNEGKIHLGLVYAHDESFRTSALMIRSAMSFGPLLDQWTNGAIDWRSMTSTPFTYLVARDSMVPASMLFAHYDRVQAAYEEELTDHAAHYIGRRPARLWDVSGESSSPFASAEARTEEVALDLVKFRTVMRDRLRDKVRALYGHRVESVVRTTAGFRVEGINADREQWSLESDVVVNCLWEGRLAIDAQMGMLPRRKWLHRLKYRVLGELPRELHDLPSFTLVLGRYGDIVVYPGGKVYLSWYPACMRESSSEIGVPASWEGPCSGTVDRQQAKTIASETLAAFENIVPGISRTNVEHVDAGAIVAWGERDIDDPDSELHERFDIGVYSHEGYFSIDTGKLTCAPFFADHLSRLIE